MQNQNEPTTAHNHVLKMIRLLESRALELQPGLQFFIVLHDDWCDLLQGNGFCNCDPEVTVKAPSLESLGTDAKRKSGRDKFLKLIRKGS